MKSPDAAKRFNDVRARIESACRTAGRPVDSVRLIAVTKTHPAVVVNEALALGITDIGENRVQEARDKFPALERDVTRHLIGSLQSNKVKQAVELFDVIHSVDSEKLAQAIDAHAGRGGRTIRVLLQVNVGAEPQKGGVVPGEVSHLARALTRLEHLELVGLMTIPPHDGPERARGYFAALRRIRDEVSQEIAPDSLRELSMGMTDDFDVAIEEGATMIRVGRALFGERGSR